jgi:chorismate-pyruvate lyase
MIPIQIGTGYNHAYATNAFEAIKGFELVYSIKLTLAEKILLAEIGTVEQMLSILVNDKIKVELINQKDMGTHIEREVYLCKDDTPLIVAKSIIRKGALPKEAVEDILKGKEGLGAILSKHCIETYRRLKAIDYDKEKDIVYRVYHIYCNKVPTIEISEHILRKNLAYAVNR